MKKVKLVLALLMTMSLFWIAPSAQVQALDAQSCITPENIKSWNVEMHDKSDKVYIRLTYGVKVMVTYPNGDKDYTIGGEPSNGTTSCGLSHTIPGKKLSIGEKVKVEYEFKGKILKTETITVKKGIQLPKITGFSKEASSGTGHPGSTVTVKVKNGIDDSSFYDKVKVDASGKWYYQYKGYNGVPFILDDLGYVEVWIDQDDFKEDELPETQNYRHLQLMPGIVTPIVQNNKYIAGEIAHVENLAVPTITVTFPNGRVVEKRLSKGDGTMIGDHDYKFAWSVEIPSDVVLKPQDKVKVQLSYEYRADGDGINPNAPVQPIVAVVQENMKTPTVNYSAHVQNIGWQTPVKDGALAGTSGKGLRVESFRMNLTNLPVSGGIKYATHVQNIGWQNAVSDDQISGTTGKSLRMEAMKISLTGEMSKYYDVYYRTHIQNYGWLGWAKNGEEAGSQGKSLRMEAIEVKLVKKGEQAPSKTDDLAFLDFNVGVSYSAHVQNIGWQNFVSNGKLSGTSGKSLRVESFKMGLNTSYYGGSAIEYATHIQNIGWQKPVSNWEMSGTEGKSLRMEAIRVNLKGSIAKYYDVYYRTHIQNYGWLGWAKNGQNAGSEGKSLRMEAIEVKLVAKGDPAPKTGASYVLANGKKV